MSSHSGVIGDINPSLTNRESSNTLAQVTGGNKVGGLTKEKARPCEGDKRPSVAKNLNWLLNSQLIYKTHLLCHHQRFTHHTQDERRDREIPLKQSGSAERSQIRLACYATCYNTDRLSSSGLAFGCVSGI